MATDSPTPQDSEELKSTLLERLSRLKEGSTMCPGALAKEHGTELKNLRPLLKKLHDQHKIEVLQKGEPRENLDEVKGPFRVKAP